MAPKVEQNATDTPVSVTPPNPLQEIFTIEVNEDHLRTLVELLKSSGRSLIPFIGAGLSAPYQFAVWRDFLLQQSERAAIKSKIAKRVKNGQYEEAANDLLLALGPTAFHDAVEREYGDHKLMGKSFAGAHAHLAKIAVGPVITTNFDHVLETAFGQVGSEFVEKVWGAKPLMIRNALNKNERLLLKLHGDVKDDTDRILTQDDYQSHYGTPNGLAVDMSKPLPKLLHMMLLGRPILFIGCSLNSDRTLNVMKHVADDFHETRHWAIVEMPATKRELVARNLFLSHHNIRPIWYPHGRHGFVEQILKYLADQIPPP